ncbi:Asp-tRNA(Asn)/Glu-tRNA(Gln) amidotransferase subunit GatA [Ignavibacteria bacterium]|nr:Asp-tRNA(Asn)/Glu-tRNA(Gln) amidotransferase subunit GatA [Bacteroidota bacterium]MCZ2131631.1 Asp-tRNA(Asn)/Glu-tRNA(Gln) amidotransferase subunit GatA [Bacteroidota bacterium]
MKSYEEFLRSIPQKSCIDETHDFLGEISRKQELNAFITLNEENAVCAAAESDVRFADGRPRSLEGMIVALKDNIATAGIRTTCASKMLENYVPVSNASVADSLRESGAVVIGKTNMDEFAMGSSNENSVFGAVAHPLNADYVPGGSSGGSAVAVAAGMAHAALGTDTGGSVRQPAAFCGVVGFKPSYGRISRSGVVAFASSFDQIGIFAPDVYSTARIFDAVSGRDRRDSTTADLPPAQSFDTVRRPLPEHFTVATLPDDQLEGCDEDVMCVYRRSLEIWLSAGAKIMTATIPHSEAWIPAYYVLATAEASSNLARFDGIRYGCRVAGDYDDITVASRSQGFGAEVKRRIMLGTYVLSSGYYDSYFGKAQRARRLIYDGYASIFEKADILFLPTTPTPAFRRGEKINDPVAMYLSDYFTVSANLAGIPAVSVPAGESAGGMPVGMQLQARRYDDERLLQFARCFQESAKI